MSAFDNQKTKLEDNPTKESLGALLFTLSQEVKSFEKQKDLGDFQTRLNAIIDDSKIDDLKKLEQDINNFKGDIEKLKKDVDNKDNKDVDTRNSVSPKSSDDDRLDRVKDKTQKMLEATQNAGDEAQLTARNTELKILKEMLDYINLNDQALYNEIVLRNKGNNASLDTQLQTGTRGRARRPIKNGAQSETDPTDLAYTDIKKHPKLHNLMVRLKALGKEYEKLETIQQAIPVILVRIKQIEKELVTKYPDRFSANRMGSAHRTDLDAETSADGLTHTIRWSEAIPNLVAGTRTVSELREHVDQTNSQLAMNMIASLTTDNAGKGFGTVISLANRESTSLKEVYDYRTHHNNNISEEDAALYLGLRKYLAQTYGRSAQDVETLLTGWVSPSEWAAEIKTQKAVKQSGINAKSLGEKGAKATVMNLLTNTGKMSNDQAQRWYGNLRWALPVAGIWYSLKNYGFAKTALGGILLTFLKDLGGFGTWQEAIGRFENGKDAIAGKVNDINHITKSNSAKENWRVIDSISQIVTDGKKQMSDYLTVSNNEFVFNIKKFDSDTDANGPLVVTSKTDPMVAQNIMLLKAVIASGKQSEIQASLRDGLLSLGITTTIYQQNKGDISNILTNFKKSQTVIDQALEQGNTTSNIYRLNTSGTAKDQLNEMRKTGTWKYTDPETSQQETITLSDIDTPAEQKELFEKMLESGLIVDKTVDTSGVVSLADLNKVELYAKNNVFPNVTSLKNWSGSAADKTKLEANLLTKLRDINKGKTDVYEYVVDDKGNLYIQKSLKGMRTYKAAKFPIDVGSRPEGHSIRTMGINNITLNTPEDVNTYMDIHVFFLETISLFAGVSLADDTQQETNFKNYWRPSLTNKGGLSFWKEEHITNFLKVMNADLPPSLKVPSVYAKEPYLGQIARGLNEIGCWRYTSTIPDTYQPIPSAMYQSDIVGNDIAINKLQQEKMLADAKASVQRFIGQYQKDKEGYWNNAETLDLMPIQKLDEITNNTVIDGYDAKIVDEAGNDYHMKIVQSGNGYKIRGGRAWKKDANNNFERDSNDNKVKGGYNDYPVDVSRVLTFNQAVTLTTKILSIESALGGKAMSVHDPIYAAGADRITIGKFNLAHYQAQEDIYFLDRTKLQNPNLKSPTSIQSYNASLKVLSKNELSAIGSVVANDAQGLADWMVMLMQDENTAPDGKSRWFGYGESERPKKALDGEGRSMTNVGLDIFEWGVGGARGAIKEVTEAANGGSSNITKYMQDNLQYGDIIKNGTLAQQEVMLRVINFPQFRSYFALVDHLVGRRLEEFVEVDGKTQKETLSRGLTKEEVILILAGQIPSTFVGTTDGLIIEKFVTEVKNYPGFAIQVFGVHIDASGELVETGKQSSIDQLLRQHFTPEQVKAIFGETDAKKDLGTLIYRQFISNTYMYNVSTMQTLWMSTKSAMGRSIEDALNAAGSTGAAALGAIVGAIFNGIGEGINKIDFLHDIGVGLRAKWGALKSTVTSPTTFPKKGVGGLEFTEDNNGNKTGANDDFDGDTIPNITDDDTDDDGVLNITDTDSWTPKGTPPAPTPPAPTPATPKKKRTK